MIPMFATVRIRRPGRPGFPVWIPLILIWLLLLPLVLVLLPVLWIACLVGRVNPIRMIRVLWGILCGMSGARVEIVNGRHSVLVRVV